MSADGRGVAEVPPERRQVPHLHRPDQCRRSRRAPDRSFWTLASRSSVRAVTAAPIRRPDPLAVASCRSWLTPDRSTTQPVRSMPFLSWGRRSVPPATSFASGPRSASVRTHSSTLLGITRSNRRTRLPLGRAVLARPAAKRSYQMIIRRAISPRSTVHCHRGRPGGSDGLGISCGQRCGTAARPAKGAAGEFMHGAILCSKKHTEPNRRRQGTVVTTDPVGLPDTARRR